MMKWQHCKLQKNNVSFLGATSAFDSKKNAHESEQDAFSYLEDNGWELVTVLVAGPGDWVYFFKRPAEDDDAGANVRSGPIGTIPRKPPKVIVGPSGD